jgi:hypothetical protein
VVLKALEVLTSQAAGLPCRQITNNKIKRSHLFLPEKLRASNMHKLGTGPWRIPYYSGPPHPHFASVYWRAPSPTKPVFVVAANSTCDIYASQNTGVTQRSIEGLEQSVAYGACPRERSMQPFVDNIFSRVTYWDFGAPFRENRSRRLHDRHG